MTPTRACVCDLGDGRTVHAALWAAGSPDLDQQIADFDLRHPDGQDGHQRVERLPKVPAERDIPWGWSPGSSLPFPGASGRPGAAQGAAGKSDHAGGAAKRPISVPLAGRGQA